MLRSKIIRFIQKKEVFLLLIQGIALVGLFGWVSGQRILASYSIKYIPIAPSNITLLFIVSLIFLVKLHSGNSQKTRKATDVIVGIIAIFCLIIFLQHCLTLSWDIENAFIKKPGLFGGLSTGRMSPISSLVYMIILIGIWGIDKNNISKLKYLGGTFSLLSFSISSILLIGYLYKAPLLYGGRIIPVSLPSVIGFYLFSLTLLRTYESRYWTFNLFEKNKVTRLLLKSFLPVVVLIVIFQGFLITNFSLFHSNLTLSVAVGLIIIVILTGIILSRISGMIGNQILRAEQKLKESDTKYRMIADYNYDWEFWITHDFKFKYNSPSCERISGYKASDFAENPDLITEIIHPDDINIYLAHLDAVHQTESCDGIDFRIITSWGEVRWINHVCQPVFDENGVNIGRRGSNSDITRRKNAEDLILKLNTELKELNLSKDRFLAILGHDLISPFNILLGMSDVLAKNTKTLDTDKIRKFAIGINNTANSAYKLLEDILMWAKSQQGNLAFEPRRLQLDEVCRETVELLTSNAKAKNIEIDYSGTGHICIFADVNMVRTILRNLVNNAIKFTGQNGNVAISAQQNHSKVIITVADNGVGIESETLLKLFDIGRVVTTKGTANEEGTGLGLILCKDFIEKHGCKIWVESKPGKGSRFMFTLPLGV